MLFFLRLQLLFPDNVHHAQKSPDSQRHTKKSDFILIDPFLKSHLIIMFHSIINDNLTGIPLTERSNRFIHNRKQCRIRVTAQSDGNIFQNIICAARTEIFIIRTPKHVRPRNFIDQRHIRATVIHHIQSVLMGFGQDNLRLWKYCQKLLLHLIHTIRKSNADFI